MQLRPHGSRLLIRKYSDDATAGGIIIPEFVKKVSLRAKVIEVGSDCTTVEVGDDIFLGTYAPIQVATKYYQDTKESYHGKGDEDDLFIMNEDDILLFAEPSKDAKKGKKDAK
jgi:co-chaperonin GroES (HSP10)